MPCRGCGSHSPGKTRCVVCDTKWCNSCLYDNAQQRSSGWKCKGCVGTSSNRPPGLTRDGESDYNYDKYLALNRIGYNINDSNKHDIQYRAVLEQMDR